MGKAGRSYLRTLLFVLILVGPIHNMLLNSEEAVRVFSCAAYLKYNLTKHKIELMVDPFINVLFGMQKNVSIVQLNFQKFENVVNPIYQEIENLDTNKMM
jgi:hypothetical protein